MCKRRTAEGWDNAALRERVKSEADYTSGALVSMFGAGTFVVYRGVRMSTFALWLAEDIGEFQKVEIPELGPESWTINLEVAQDFAMPFTGGHGVPRIGVVLSTLIRFRDVMLSSITHPRCPQGETEIVLKPGTGSREVKVLEILK